MTTDSERPFFPDDFFQAYLSKLLSGDRMGCASDVRALLDEDVDIRHLYLDLFQRSLYEVGRLWEANAISVSVEHLATAITEYLLTLVYPVLFEGNREGGTAVVSCVAGEYHQIGPKMVADIFEMCGWNTQFLGASTPTEDLVDFIGRTCPDMLALSLSIFFNLQPLLELLDRLAQTFPSLPILVGGQAFRFGGLEAVSRFKQVTYLPSILDLESHLKELR